MAFRDEMMTWRITQSITSIDEAGSSTGGSLTHDLPPQSYSFLSEILANNFSVEYAKRVMDTSQLLNIRTAVKSKLLDFLLQLNDEIIEDETNIPSQQMDQFKELFKNTVFGDNTTILVGNHNNQKVENRKIMKGNFDIAKSELKKHGVDDTSIEELRKIIDNDNPDTSQKQPGEKVKGWMMKMLGKALDGSWTIGIGAAGKIIADVVTNYYGWAN